MDSAFKYMSNNAGVDDNLTAAFGHLHARNINTLGRMENTEAEFRAWLTDDVCIDKAGTGRGLIATPFA